MSTLIAYLLMASLVVFLSMKIAVYVDLIEKKTDLSGFLVGGIILACVTSLPEFFTSISSVFFLKKSELVLGNILGSNLFNTTILLIMVFFSFKNFTKCFVTNSHRKILFCLLGVYGVLATVMVSINIFPTFYNINLVSFVICFAYAITTMIMAKDTEEDFNPPLDAEEKVDYGKLSVKTIWIRFGISAIALILSSIAITYLTNTLSKEFNLSASVAGALFLGIATSLPELVSTFQLIRLKNINSAISGITGSNIFNFIIIALADFLNGKQAIYNFDSEAKDLVIFGIATHIILLILLYIKKFIFGSKKPRYSTKLNKDKAK